MKDSQVVSERIKLKLKTLLLFKHYSSFIFVVVEIMKILYIFLRISLDRLRKFPLRDDQFALFALFVSNKEIKLKKKFLIQ